MNVSRLTLIIMAAFVWYSGGIALLFKGGALIKSAYLIDSHADISCHYYTHRCMDVKKRCRELHLSLPCWCT